MKAIDKVNADWKASKLEQRRNDFCGLIEWRMRMMGVPGGIWNPAREKEFQNRRQAEADFWKTVSREQLKAVFGWPITLGRQWHVAVFAEARLALEIDVAAIDAKPEEKR